MHWIQTLFAHVYISKVFQKHPLKATRLWSGTNRDSRPGFCTQILPKRSAHAHTLFPYCSCHSALIKMPLLQGALPH